MSSGPPRALPTPRTTRQGEARAREVADALHSAFGSPLDLDPSSNVAADTVTMVGVGASVLAGFAALFDARRTAAVAWIGSGAADVLDGQLARRQAPDPTGPLSDSVADRVSDAAIAIGVVGRELLAGRRLAAFGAAAAGMSGALPSYVTARAQAVSLDGTAVGTGRLERHVAWVAVLAQPVATLPVTAALTAVSLREAWHRYRRATR